MDALSDKQVRPALPEGVPFLVWLSHDVDRVAKQWYHAFYYGCRSNTRHHMASLFHLGEQYWNFDRIMDIERSRGVRSTFFFLNESMRPSWRRLDSAKTAWGRYDITAPRVVDIIQRLMAGGWEVGMHGSFRSFNDEALLTREKTTLEELTGATLAGNRQHYLHLVIPTTWHYLKRLGFRYDASFGLRDGIGFRDGIVHPFRPFDDSFTVFPVTIMDKCLLEGARDVGAAWEACVGVIDGCQRTGSILSVIWHQRVFNPMEFPGYGALYERLVDECRARGAVFVTGRDVFDYLEDQTVPS